LDGRAAATAQAADALEARLEALGEVEVVRTSVSGDEETRLVEAIEAAIADAPRGQLGGVFVVSDGQASDAARAETLALDAPIHLMLTGRESEVDRKITLVNAPRYGIVKEAARISFRVDDLGPDEKPLPARGQAMVTLRIDGREVLRQNVPIGAEVSFDA